LWAAITVLVSAMAGAFGLAVLVRYFWKDDWSWTVQLITAAAGVAALLLVEFLLTFLLYWTIGRYRRWRDRRRT
jgi:putative flippase GtrA